jgi:hypothetical protein
MIGSAIDKGLAVAADRIRVGEDWLLGAKRATYGLSVVRIIFGITMLWFLVANWSNRHYLWGNAAQWMSPLDHNGGFGWPFTLFAGGSGPTGLTIKMLVVFALAIAFTLGWHTRLVTPLLLICWVSLIESNPLYGDQSDNIFRILLIYLCFTDLSSRWSLDARRRWRIATGQPRRPVPAMSQNLRRNIALLSTLLHNLAVLAAGAQICIIYLASALYKAQGEYWQDGTAVYYPMQVSQYRPWPFLSDLLSSNSLGVLVISYFSVFIQLFFPLMLLRRATRMLAIIGVLGMHVGIGVLMGLPFFSLFIMAGDQIFIRDQTYAAISAKARQYWHRRRNKRPGRSSPIEDSVSEPAFPVSH